MMHEMDILRMASAVADHAGRRQGVIARNIANADTPGFRAQDLTPFSQVWRETSGFPAHATRPGHAGYDPAAVPPARTRFVTAVGASSPNGNTVSIEDQMGRAAETKMQHDVALGVWRSAMNILRASVSGGQGR